MSKAATRSKRAQSEEMSATVISSNEIAVNSENSDESHIVETRGSEAVSCTCPDFRFSRPKDGCKHMRAWEDWAIDVVAFSDGEVFWERD